MMRNKLLLIMKKKRKRNLSSTFVTGKARKWLLKN
jgi:hypothetical protein